MRRDVDASERRHNNDDDETESASPSSSSRPPLVRIITPRTMYPIRLSRGLSTRLGIREVEAEEPADEGGPALPTVEVNVLPLHVALTGRARVSRYFLPAAAPARSTLLGAAVTTAAPSSSSSSSSTSSTGTATVTSSAMYSQFRGRVLCGAEIVLPSHYTGTPYNASRTRAQASSARLTTYPPWMHPIGLVLEEPQPQQQQQEDAGAKAPRQLCAVGRFDRYRYWLRETPPSSLDLPAQWPTWLALADLVRVMCSMITVVFVRERE